MLCKVVQLLDAGANLHYLHHGCPAVIDAAFALGRVRRPTSLALLELLLQRGAQPDAVTPCGESALGILSRDARFDAVALLLEAGADPTPLGWTRLHRAIALGTLAEVNAALDAGEDPEARDPWQRTALLLAIQTGDLHKLELLLLHGVDREVRGALGRPAVLYAVDMPDPATLKWLLTEGFPLHVNDAEGVSALAWSAQCGNFEVVRRWLDEGVDPKPHERMNDPLEACESRSEARRLLEGGADPLYLDFEMRRELAGLPPAPDRRLLTATRDEFERGAHPRFGRHNPERIDEPFWRAMLLSGINGMSAASHVGFEVSRDREPIWCSDRLGQSITFLEDGRVIQVGGEHEDSYDPDFCIYNDVFVHYPDGRFEIYGYPEEVFPPTDFHSATRVGDLICLIGAIGYRDRREFGCTPVYLLDTRTLRIDRVETKGEAPGWIYNHRALLMPDRRVRIFGGMIETGPRNNGRIRNQHHYELDLQTRVWVRIENA